MTKCNEHANCLGISVEVEVEIESNNDNCPVNPKKSSVFNWKRLYPSICDYLRSLMMGIAKYKKRKVNDNSLLKGSFKLII